MYVKSIAVACQAICIISIGPLADSAYWRKRLLLTFAYSGSLSGILFLLLPSSPYAWTPIVAALLNIVGNATYATSIVCSNAFLPGLAKEDVDVQKAWEEAAPEDSQEALGDVNEDDEEESRRIVNTEDEATHLLPDRLIPAIRAISTQDLALSDPLTKSVEPFSAKKHYESLLSLTTSRLSSTGTAIGFFSGVSVLTLLLVPVMALGGSTFSMRLAIGLSGVWWALFSVPTWMGLPGGAPGQESDFNASQVKEAWLKIGRMIAPKQMRQLPNLYIFLLAWIFLSDGFHTTTYAAILYASSVLSMSAPKIIVIGILVQLSAVISSILIPRIQRHLSTSSSKPVTNYKVLFVGVVAAALIPVYTSAGLVLPFGGLRSEGEMYFLAVWFGLVFGPFLSYSRAVYAELIPPGHESTFFSLFSFTDKSASFIGPATVGLISDLTGNIRYGFLFLLAMLVVPIPVLGRVKVEQGRREAVEWTERLRKEMSSERI
ncbi:UMF1 family MFS transporter [Cryptococcus gattii Ru294]|uniref:Autophagy-related protein n=2 Tax=Cryptococcus gattii TaxID=37769 RepID=E6R8Q9_CRYGW|nr:uncharacterized protein CGB_F6250C [Cryptococcus gattii WM276]KIR52160.1 UMF1 family MFS transporter [Cryptococcus gattii Ru294]KIR82438.1 UMF1 family MFS transporter [Cryptococcus gattii EJB2]KIY30808.1 UMF1 family MFS transporter [Cryptococcus gattii E566]KJE00863.1 UMF1 family MFS transporter [Cryptococcus gattii NT-10]ADV23204.1 Conserved hypothetical protein [Cryptococcus gattii WM276]